MGWATAGAIVGMVVNIASAKREDDRAKEAMENANQSETTELDFAMQQQRRWESVFGPIQDNLSDYYRDLDADTIAAIGLENFEMEQDAAMNRVRANLSQRGLYDSGIAASLETANEYERASERARIRAEAPMKLAQERSNFLSLGLQAEPSRDTLATLSRRTGRADQQAADAVESSNIATEQAGGSIQNLISVLGEREG